MTGTYINATLDAFQDFLIDERHDPKAAWLTLKGRIATLYDEHEVAVLIDAFGTDDAADDDATPNPLTDEENAAWVAWLEEFQRDRGAGAVPMANPPTNETTASASAD
jgi:hypothetical protein